jgi:hypothetical protein
LAVGNATASFRVTFRGSHPVFIEDATMVYRRRLKTSETATSTNADSRFATSEVLHQAVTSESSTFWLGYLLYMGFVFIPFLVSLFDHWVGRVVTALVTLVVLAGIALMVRSALRRVAGTTLRIRHLMVLTAIVALDLAACVANSLWVILSLLLGPFIVGRCLWPPSPPGTQPGGPPAR